MESYHTLESRATGADETARPTVAESYVRIPTIELIRQKLCAHGAGALVETSVRKLARAIDRSCGQISVHLDQLEADGWIRRISESAGTVVEVLRTDHPHDRSFSASESDHADDRFAPTDHPALMPNPARSAADSGAKSDHADDPPHTPLYGTQENHDQEEESARAALFDRLLAEPRMNRKLAERIAKHPLGTVADFESDLRIAQTFAKTPFFFTVGRWRDGQRVIAPEVCYERPIRTARTARTARPGTDTAKRQLDPTGAAYPERGPVRTRLTY